MAFSKVVISICSVSVYSVPYIALYSDSSSSLSRNNIRNTESLYIRLTANVSFANRHPSTLYFKLQNKLAVFSTIAMPCFIYIIILYTCCVKNCFALFCADYAFIEWALGTATPEYFSCSQFLNASCTLLNNSRQCTIRLFDYSYFILNNLLFCRSFVTIIQKGEAFRYFFINNNLLLNINLICSFLLVIVLFILTECS